MHSLNPFVVGLDTTIASDSANVAKRPSSADDRGLAGRIARQNAQDENALDVSVVSLSVAREASPSPYEVLCKSADNGSHVVPSMTTATPASASLPSKNPMPPDFPFQKGASIQLPPTALEQCILPGLSTDSTLLWCGSERTLGTPFTSPRKTQQQMVRCDGPFQSPLPKGDFHQIVRGRGSLQRWSSTGAASTPATPDGELVWVHGIRRVTPRNSPRDQSQCPEALVVPRGEKLGTTLENGKTPTLCVSLTREPTRTLSPQPRAVSPQVLSPQALSPQVLSPQPGRPRTSSFGDAQRLTVKGAAPCWPQQEPRRSFSAQLPFCAAMPGMSAPRRSVQGSRNRQPSSDGRVGTPMGRPRTPMNRTPCYPSPVMWGQSLNGSR